jgi:hypothetical protein
MKFVTPTIYMCRRIGAATTVQFTAAKIIAAVVADVPTQRHACPLSACTTATAAAANSDAATAVIQQQQPVCTEEVLRFVLADTACTLQQIVSCDAATAVTTDRNSTQCVDRKTVHTATLKTLASAQVQDFSTLMWVPLLHSAAIDVKGELSETDHASSSSSSTSSSSDLSDSSVSVAVAVDGAAVTVGAQALQALTWCSTVIKGLAVKPEFKSYRIFNRSVVSLNTRNTDNITATALAFGHIL